MERFRRCPAEKRVGPDGCSSRAHHPCGRVRDCLCGCRVDDGQAGGNASILCSVIDQHDLGRRRTRHRWTSMRVVLPSARPYRAGAGATARRPTGADRCVQRRSAIVLRDAKRRRPAVPAERDQTALEAPQALETRYVNHDHQPLARQSHRLTSDNLSSLGRAAMWLAAPETSRDAFRYALRGERHQQAEREDTRSDQAGRRTDGRRRGSRL